MGQAMARRLAEQGFSVVVYNRTLEKAESFQRQFPHTTIASTAAEAVQTAETVITMLADDQAVTQVANGPRGILAGLKPEQVWIDCSTISPELSQSLSRDAAQVGAVRLEAPVGGSVNAAESGTLVVWLGGDVEAVSRVEPVLQVLAARYEYVGPVGQALALKLAINLNLGIQVAALAEGLLLAHRSGIALDRALELMLNSAIASPAMKYRGPWMLELPDMPWFKLDLMKKDLELALAEVSHPAALPLSQTTDHLLQEASQSGWGNQELAALLRALYQRWVHLGELPKSST